MLAATKNNIPIHLRQLHSSDFENLLHYLNNLSAETKSRFGPHAFTMEAIEAMYGSGQNFTGYTAIEESTGTIIAYAIIKKGLLQHDTERLQHYGLVLNEETDCTFAPSVADEWQSLGVGKLLFSFIWADLMATGFKRIILWGGVQSSNHKAVQYYTNNGFYILGAFEYNGQNLDMACDIT